MNCGWRLWPQWPPLKMKMLIAEVPFRPGAVRRLLPESEGHTLLTKRKRTIMSHERRTIAFLTGFKSLRPSFNLL